MQQRRLGGFGVAMKCPHRLAAELEMERELRRGHLAAIGALALQRDGDLAMQLGTGKRADALVQHFAIQLVAESIAGVGERRLRREGHLGQPALAARELRASLCETRNLAFQYPRKRREPELNAADARRVEQPALLRSELPDVTLDDSGERLRRRHRTHAFQGGRSAAGCRLVVANEIVHHAGDEERHPVGQGIQRAHELFVCRQRRHVLRQVSGHFLLRERVEHDVLAQPMKAQLVAHGAQGLIGGDDLRKAEAGEPQQPRGSAPARHVVDELHGRLVRPVQVFDDEQQTDDFPCSGRAARPFRAACAPGRSRSARAAKPRVPPGY